MQLLDNCICSCLTVYRPTFHLVLTLLNVKIRFSEVAINRFSEHIAMAVNQKICTIDMVRDCGNFLRIEVYLTGK